MTANSPDTSDPDQSLKEFSVPIWENTHWARQALELYEGISVRAEEINKTNYGHFFGCSQHFALAKTVIDICKLYDTTNKKHAKHTIPELLDFFKASLRELHAQRIKLYINKEEVAKLQLAPLDVSLICRKLSNSKEYGEAKEILITKLKEKMPDVKNNLNLQRIFTFRNKIGAHQEVIEAKVKAEISDLPPIEKMYDLIAWAEDFCYFVMSVLRMGDTIYLKSNVSAYRAALKVVAKILDKDLKSMTYDECEKFYGSEKS